MNSQGSKPSLIFQYPKLCGYYKFEKGYFQQLKDDGIIIVGSSNQEQAVEQEERSVHSPNGDRIKNELEKKMESLIWKMNMLFVCVLV